MKGTGGGGVLKAIGRPLDSFHAGWATTEGVCARVTWRAHFDILQGEGGDPLVGPEAIQGNSAGGCYNSPGEGPPPTVT